MKYDDRFCHWRQDGGRRHCVFRPHPRDDGASREPCGRDDNTVENLEQRVECLISRTKYAMRELEDHKEKYSLQQRLMDTFQILHENSRVAADLLNRYQAAFHATSTSHTSARRPPRR